MLWPVFLFLYPLGNKCSFIETVGTSSTGAEHRRPQSQLIFSPNAVPIFSPKIGSQTDWNHIFSKTAQAKGTIEEFKKMMYKVQQKRRQLVLQLLNKDQIGRENPHSPRMPIPQAIDNCAQLLRTVHGILSDPAEPLFQKTFLLSGSNEKLFLNVKDEVLGIQKDLTFLDAIRSKYRESKEQNNGHFAYLAQNIISNLDYMSILAPYHPISAEQFQVEHASCVRFLRKYIVSSRTQNKKGIMITDWDGTMKDYCSQYATSLQPIYSALSMANFAEAYTRLTVVLTAGPLRGPGILELISLPKDGPVIFGGSLGREWWLGFRRIVHDDGISGEGLTALEMLSEKVNTLLTSHEYGQFAMIGSGVQCKVDRLTLAVQTVFNHVNPDLSVMYQNEIRQRVQMVDPYGKFLHFEPSRLEVEVVVKNDHGMVWNKANGMAHLVDTLGDTLKSGPVLIGGDTNSDIPMVAHAKAENPEGVMALFVTSDTALQTKIRNLVGDPDRFCFVSTPDVIHAAMASLANGDEDMT